jgi:hypothetical protein
MQGSVHNRIAGRNGIQDFSGSRFPPAIDSKNNFGTMGKRILSKFRSES